jgi:hypothetical protein
MQHRGQKGAVGIEVVCQGSTLAHKLVPGRGWSDPIWHMLAALAGLLLARIVIW